MQTPTWDDLRASRLHNVHLVQLERWKEASPMRSPDREGRQVREVY